MRSSSSGSHLNQHQRVTQHLQRQSNANSSRNYYYGEKKHNPSSNKSTNKHQTNSSTRRRQSITSSSSSSLSDPKERMRQQGARSKDSGFRSPNQHHRFVKPNESSQQIYSVSSKTKNRHRDEHDYDDERPLSPTGSVGQRSVKTTTTTVSAGLADRPGKGSKQAKEEAKGRPSSANSKVSKPPSPFQKFARLFAPSSSPQKQRAH